MTATDRRPAADGVRSQPQAEVDPRHDTASRRIILITGLGADERFLKHQAAAFPGSEALNWMPWEKRESLAGYAKRLAERIRRDGERRPVVLAGVSLGGMLALEVSRHVPTERIILMSSTREPGAVSGVLKLIEGASRIVPLPVLWLMRFGVVPMGLLDPTRSMAQKRLIASMGMRCSMTFMRRASRAILEWPGLPDPDAPVHHIHGAWDAIIPAARLRHPPDEIVPKGPHILPLSHPEAVNSFIRRVLQSNAASTKAPAQASSSR